MTSHITNDIELSPLFSKVEEFDDSKKLSDYFISSSHNTYLSQGQLYGNALASQYSNVLNNGCRCVEIDLWDGDNDEPKVTHGFTLTDRLSFREACQSINSSINSTDLPVIISLENHASVKQQEVAVEIMKETFGDKLITKPLNNNHQPSIGELRGKIIVKVEYYPSSIQTLQEQTEHLKLNNNKKVVDDDNSDKDHESDDEETRKERELRQNTKIIICNALSELGIYACSVKPGKKQWWNDNERISEPRNAVINTSEIAMGKLLKSKDIFKDIRSTTSNQLIRVYPHGMRIYSKNLDPLPLWRVGSQIVALNFQVFDRGLQLNRALFRNTNGYVLKPKNIRSKSENEDNVKKNIELTIHVYGASDVPHSSGTETDKSFKTFFRAKLYTMENDVRHKTKSITAPNPLWDNKMKWIYDSDDTLAMLRCKIVHDIPFHPDATIATWCCRVNNLNDGWHLIEMDDENGEISKATTLIHVSKKVL